MDITNEIKLVKFIKENLGRPFAWGECDCNVFALEVIDAVYGTALAENIKGKYSDELSAISFRAQSKWKDFSGLLKVSGFAGGMKGFEQVGDILIVDAPNFELVHIYMGKSIVSVPLGMTVHLTPYALMKYLDYQVWRKIP